jgi:autotransporter-associated beta strand protein
VIEVAGSGSLLVNGGPWSNSYLLGNATMTGGTTIQSGILTIGGRANSSVPSTYDAGSIAGDISNEGTLNFDITSGFRTYNGTISGNGSVGVVNSSTSGATGTIFLTGNNTYTGGTLVRLGNMWTFPAGTLSSNGAVNITGGNLHNLVTALRLSEIYSSQWRIRRGLWRWQLCTASSVDLRQGVASLGFTGGADLAEKRYSSLFR